MSFDSLSNFPKHANKVGILLPIFLWARLSRAPVLLPLVYLAPKSNAEPNWYTNVNRKDLDAQIFDFRSQILNIDQFIDQPLAPDLGHINSS